MTPRRFPWRLALRVVTIAELVVACALGVSGACPWPVALVAAEAVLAVFLSTIPEPVRWVAVPESERAPSAPLRRVVAERMRNAPPAPPSRAPADTGAGRSNPERCARCGGDWFECRSAACRGLR